MGKSRPEAKDRQITLDLLQIKSIIILSENNCNGLLNKDFNTVSIHSIINLYLKKKFCYFRKKITALQLSPTIFLLGGCG